MDDLIYIKPIILNESVYDKNLMNQLVLFCDQIQNSNDRLKENYKIENIDPFNHKGLWGFISKADHKLVGFSGLYNGNRYPKGVYRILNRTYLADEYRIKGKYQFGLRKLLLNEILANFENEISALFISRQGINGRLFLKKWVATIDQPGWQISDGFAQVSLGELRHCFQYIAIKKLKPITWSYKEVSLKEWKKIPI